METFKFSDLVSKKNFKILLLSLALSIASCSNGNVESMKTQNQDNAQPEIKFSEVKNESGLNPSNTAILENAQVEAGRLKNIPLIVLSKIGFYKTEVDGQKTFLQIQAIKDSHNFLMVLSDADGNLIEGFEMKNWKSPYKFVRVVEHEALTKKMEIVGLQVNQNKLELIYLDTNTRLNSYIPLVLDDAAFSHFINKVGNKKLNDFSKSISQNPMNILK